MPQGQKTADIIEHLGGHGLLLRGGFLIDPERDGELLRRLPTARQLLLIGNAGSAIWSHVANFIAENPAELHPLDRWSERVIDALARQIGAISLTPNEGPPWWPFQQWARRVESVWPSPVSVLIHPRYGLWHAYRGALLLQEPINLPMPQSAPSPCITCNDRPCLSACPVGAFSATGYDVESCASHVNSTAGKACQTRGCLARLACPVGRDFHYEPDHAAFHMAAFRRAHPTTS